MGLFPKWFHLSYLASAGGWWRGGTCWKQQTTVAGCRLTLAPDLWQCDAVSRIHQPRDTRPAHRHQLTLQDTCLGNYWPMVNTKQRHRQLSNTSISSQTFVPQLPLVKANFMKSPELCLWSWSLRPHLQLVTLTDNWVYYSCVHISWMLKQWFTISGWRQKVEDRDVLCLLSSDSVISVTFCLISSYFTLVWRDGRNLPGMSPISTSCSDPQTQDKADK